MGQRNGKTFILYIIEFIVVAAVTVVIGGGYIGGNSFLSYPEAIESKGYTLAKMEVIQTEIDQKTELNYQMLDSNSMLCQQLEEAGKTIDKLRLINSDYVSLGIATLDTPYDGIETLQVTLSGDIDLGYDAVKSALPAGTCISSYTYMNGEKPELILVFNVKK